MIIKMIARALVLVFIMAVLLLASNKHKSEVRLPVNFWLVLAVVCVMSGFLWIGGFFG